MFKKIKSFLTKTREFEDDRDEKYIYKENAGPFTVFFINLFSKQKVRADRRLQTFGRIKGNIFFYISFPMIFVFGVIVWAVYAAFSNLLPYYNTNVFLNSLIISFMIFGILKTFHNSYIIYKTARFFRLMESIIRKDNIPKEDIYALRRSMETDGVLANTVTMVETIDDIERFGHPNFNDHRARLIKSKLGFRVSKGKGNVSYIAGILVMLGLLGTFLGLLATIDSVGDALAGMSNIGSGGQGIGTEDMSTFITSLSKPLEGMGLAFSSSLFGLSGSLLIGFFLYLSGTPQNDFMENISRWIDNRIPKHNPKHTEMVKKNEKAAKDDKNDSDNEDDAVAEEKPENKEEKLAKINPPVGDQDLKSWLSGYIYMSVKMNNSVKDLCEELSETNSEIQKVNEDSHALRQTQHNLMDGMNSTNLLLQDIEVHNRNLSQAIPTIVSNGQTLVTKVDEMRLSQVSGVETLFKMQENLNQVPDFIQANQGISQQLQANASLISDISSRSDVQNQKVEQANNQILNVMSTLKDLAEKSQKIETDAVILSQENIAMSKESIALEKENMSNFSEGLSGMQQGLAQVAAQISNVNEQIKSENTPDDISEIKGFVAELNGLQKELVQSVQLLSKTMSDNEYGKINETLIQKIERKINSLEDKLKGFLSNK